MKQIFESDNICFVEVSELLVNDYLAMVNDEKNFTMFTGGRVKSYTAEQELRWVKKKLEEKAFVFSMLEKPGNRFIGNIELMHLKDAEGELGIGITAKMQNRGFGTEAVPAFTEYAMRKLGLKRIFLRTSPNNARAIHVYKKCGFREYDRTPEHVYMEIIR